MMRMPERGDWVKNRDSRMPGYALATQQNAYRRIVHTTNNLVGNLYGKMKITDLPADHRRSAWIGLELNLENRFGRLGDHVALAVLPVKNRSIRNWMIKIKAKFSPILSDSPPPPFCQGCPIRKQQNDLVIAAGFIVTN
jgi:hypothetical protein